jgi:DNA replication protein DnaC
VRYPEAKGRVESAIKYVRSSFFYGRSFSSLEDLRAQAAAWLDGTANARLHARGADLLYQVFNRRYQRASTVVTTNLPFKEWGKLFHNSGAASAIADRLVHRGLLVRITGKSRRSDQEVDSAPS